MKTQLKLAVSLALLAMVTPQASTLSAQGSSLGSFTYQGRLNDANGPANGRFDFQFALFPDTFNTNNQVDTTMTVNALGVSNGLFTTELVFPQGAVDFDGSDRWLQIWVRPSFIGTNYIALSPRQRITSAPYAIAAGKLTGNVAMSQLPSAVVTNNQGGVLLSGIFSGNGGGLTNIQLAGLSTNGPNRIQSVETPGSERLNVSAWRDLVVEANLDATLWSGRDVRQTAEHDFWLRAKHDALFTVDNNFSESVGRSYSISAGQNFNVTAANAVILSASSFSLRSDANAAVTVGNNLTTMIGGSAVMNVGASLLVQANDLTLAASRFRLLPSGVAGFGLADPQANLHVLSTSSPAVLRVQSAATPGLGRLEFFSDPQGSANEWRPGFIQSSDNGGFTGGLSFFVNGTGFGNRLGEIETMRIVNGRVGIGTVNPGSKLEVVGGPGGNAIQGTCNNAGASGVYGENLTGGGFGIAGRTSNAGIAVYGDNANAAGWAGYFNGNIRVTGTINPPSDRNVKRDFASVDSREVLEKVAALSIQTWAYTNDSRGTRHLGPVAQDFKATFGLGADDKSIATVDADGVALAAIQGLNQKVEEKESRIQALEKELATLKEMVTRLSKQRD